MKMLCFSLLMTAGSLLADPCDGNPRVAPNGLTMACSLDTPKVLMADAIDVDGHLTLNVAISTLSSEAVNFSVVIGWSSLNDGGRKTVLVRAIGPFPCKAATTINLPIGAIIQFVEVQEFTRSSSVGFTR